MECEISVGLTFLFVNDIPLEVMIQEILEIYNNKHWYWAIFPAILVMLNTVSEYENFGKIGWWCEMNETLQKLISILSTNREYLRTRLSWCQLFVNFPWISSFKLFLMLLIFCQCCFVILRLHTRAIIYR